MIEKIRTLGRYALYDEIASGGMATVHFGKVLGDSGFARPVAIKRLHRNLAGEEKFTRAFVGEARLAARIRHTNVIPTLDVVEGDGELFLVMEYVAGASLSEIAKRKIDVPVPIATAIMVDVLSGLHAAHEAVDEKGDPLGIVHRDVSPHNVLVGADGTTRVFDFGIAKAVSSLDTTKQGTVKGKIAYLAPELLQGKRASRQSDIQACGVVLWELLTGRRLFEGESEAHVMTQVLIGLVKPPSLLEPAIPDALDDVVMKALEPDPAARFATAADMAKAIVAAAPTAKSLEVAAWLAEALGPELGARAEKLAAIERAPSETAAPPPATAPAPERRRPRAAAIAIAALVGVGAIVVLSNLGPRSAPRAVSPPAVAVPSMPVAQPLPPVEPAPEATTEPSSTVRPAVRPAAATRAGCNPPFVVDSLGRHIYKRGCL